MKEIKVGIVGLGRLGSVHAQNLAFKIPGCKLVAACRSCRRSWTGARTPTPQGEVHHHGSWFDRGRH